MANARAKRKPADAPALDSTLGDELERTPAPAEELPPALEPTLEHRGEGVLEPFGAGVSTVSLDQRRYGMTGSAFVSMAAARAQDARGGQEGDLVILAVAPGRGLELVELLESMGATRATHPQ